MDALKTYQNVNASNENISFAISRMEDIYAKRKGKSDDPHRHEFFTVLAVKQANGLHNIDFNSYDLGDLQIYFVAPGQVHQVIEHEASHGYVMTFSTEFLIQNDIQLSFVESLDLFHDYGQSPPLSPSKEQFNKIEYYCSEIEKLYQSEAKMKALSMGSYLKLFLIECNSICSLDPIESFSEVSENRILKEFKHLVNEHFRKEHSTSFYANQLHISADHLNRVIKNAIGITSKEYIQSRIITEAKRLLYFSDSSTKEIGYELGFSEPGNFSAFFKKCAGTSPSMWREEIS